VASYGAQLEPIDSLQLLFDSWVGIVTHEAPVQVHVFPDPATTSIRIPLTSTPVMAGEIRLFDRTGRLVRATSSPWQATLEVDVTGLDPGLYHLLWTVNGVPELKARFVKNDEAISKCFGSEREISRPSEARKPSIAGRSVRLSQRSMGAKDPRAARRVF
jgi:hypothetical protein